MSLNQVPKVTIIPECTGTGKTPLIISVLVELSGEHFCFPEAGRSLVGLDYLCMMIGGCFVETTVNCMGRSRLQVAFL